MQMGEDEEFYACLYYIKESEGGDSNDKNDKGGKTRKGVTQASYDQYLKEINKKQGNTSNQTYRSVFTLTTEEVDYFYYYWYKKYNIDKIQDLNTRYIYFDATILHGPGKAAQLSQKICNIKVDGAFGKQSIEAVNSMNQKEFQKKFSEERISHFNKIVAKDHTQNKYLKGWIDRVNKTQAQIQKRALDLGTRNKYDYKPQTNSKPQNLGGILPNQEQFKQQEKVCQPDTLVKGCIMQFTEFAQILFESDYLQDSMSLGVKTDGQTSFDYPLFSIL